MKGNSLSANIAKLIFLTVALKLVGFVSRSVVAYYFGITSDTDIYYTASGFIDSVSAVVLAGLSVGVVNIYISNSPEDRSEFISNLLSIITLITLFVALACYVFAAPISWALMPRNDAAADGLKTMLRVLSLSFPFHGAVSLLGATLQAEKRFIPLKITGTITSLTNMAFVVLFSSVFGVRALMFAYVSGSLLNALFLFAHARKYAEIRVKKAVLDAKIRQLLFMVAPLILGMAANQIHLIIDKSIASTVAVGAISALSYAGFLYLFFENVIIQSVSTAIFPEIVEEFHRNQTAEHIAGRVKTTMLFTTYILMPMVTACVVNSDFIIRLLYMRGNFGPDSVSLTTAALNGYMLGLPALGLRDISNRVYYAYGDTKAPVKINLLSIALNVILDVVLSGYWGIFGITAATSISNAFSAAVMAAGLKSYNGHIYERRLCAELLFLTAASLFAGIGCMYVKACVNPWVSLLAAFIAALGGECIVAFAFRSVILERVKRMLSGARPR